MNNCIRHVREAVLSFAVLAASNGATAADQAPAGASAPAAGAVVSCVDIAKDEPRPPYGCFNLAHVSGLQFNAPAAIWFLYRFTSEAAAEAARGEHGTVVGEAEAFWLSELAPEGTMPAQHAGGVLVAQVGPLALPRAAAYTATLAYAVMQPGQRSRIHTHPGPEAFYVVSGEQCVETPSGAKRARAGEAFDEPAGVPMELMAVGTQERRGFALVLHDSAKAQAAPAAWRPRNLCRSP